MTENDKSKVLECPECGGNSIVIPAEIRKNAEVSCETCSQSFPYGQLLMGKKLYSQYNKLWNEIAWINLKWNEYVCLFGEKRERIELLNEAAGQFFRITQDALWNDVILHICRLTDPPKSCGKSNLTICSLPDLISKKSLKTEVSSKIEEVKEKTNFCRDWRNRALAHKDLRLALEDGAEPLQMASREKVKEALEGIADVMDIVSANLMDSTSWFGYPQANGTELLYILHDGLKAKHDRQARIESGQHHQEDFQFPDI